MRSKTQSSKRSVVKREKAATPAQIDRMRERYVEMIAMARKFDPHPSAMVDKAHRLLTRHWGNSDWASRAAILKTVDWLMKVAMIHPTPAPKEARSAPSATMPANRPAMVRRSPRA